MKFHDFSPFYRSGEGIRSKVSGDRLIDNPAVADAQGGSDASFSFDGVTDVVSVGDDPNLDWGTGDGSVEVWVRSSSTSSLDERILTKLTTVTPLGFSLMTDGPAHTLNLTIYTAAGNVIPTGTTAINDGEWHHVAVTFDRSSNAIIYLNGVEEASESITGISGDWSNSGDLQIGNYSETNPNFGMTNGQISQVRIHNRALTADEVRASYNGQAVGFEYRGASQDALITGDDSNFGAGSHNWAGSLITMNYNPSDGSGHTSTMRVEHAADTSPWAQTYINKATEVGKKYRLQFWYRSVSGEDNHALGIYNVNLAAWNNNTTAGGIADLDATSWTYHTEEFIAEDTSTNIYIYVSFGAYNATDEILVDTLTLTQIGCVAEYLPESISDATWLDSSGNELDGSVSGATAVNAEAGIVARDSHLLESKTVADLQSGASFKFDGVDDGVLTNQTAMYDIVGAGSSGTVSAWFKYDSFEANGNAYLNGAVWGYGNVNASLTHTSTTNKPVIFYWNTSAAANYTVVGTTPLVAGAWYQAVYVWSGSNSKLYINGVKEFDGDNIGFGHDLTDAAAGAGRNFRMGSTGSDGITNSIDGQVSQVRLHNRALSAAEVRAAYNGQAVPFEYVGGSQDELVTAWTNSDFDAFTSSGTTITEAESDGSGAQNCWSSMAVETGKKYQMTCTVGGTVGDDLSFKVAPNSVALNSATLTHNITATGSTTLTWIQPDDPDNTVYVGFRSQEEVCDFTISDFSLTQIGCVAEFLPSGINATQWVDTSGNNLHGTTSTATAVNHTTGALTMVDDIRMEAGAGINFSPYDDAAPTPPAVGSSSNLLNDYEEGTFGGTGANEILQPHTSGSVTCGTNGILSYTKIGNTCYVRGRVDITAVSSPVNTLYLHLPFQSAVGIGTSSVAGCGIHTQNVDFAGGTSPTIQISSNSLLGYIWVVGDSLAVQAVNPAVGDIYGFSFNYEV